MTCSCGKELEMIRVLDEKEKQDLDYISERKDTANKMVLATQGKADEMNDKQLMEYYSAIHAFIAETDFLEHKFIRDLKKLLGKEHLMVQNYIIYAHE